jgi:tRNA-dihydrouridine synthase A
MMRYSHFPARQLWRFLCPPALLYTEMLTAEAVIYGRREQLLKLPAEQQPVVVQLGGASPDRLAEAARIAEAMGAAEINFNCGCPSPRVRCGHFGASLMKTPELMARCVEAMAAAVQVPVTVKCRLAVDDMDAETALDDFCRRVFAAGARALVVHARRAWLDGLNPAQNRTVPPLDYARAYRLKESIGDKSIIINGGINTVEEALRHLIKMDGVMLGRAVVRSPYMLAAVARNIFGITPPERCAALRYMLEKAAQSPPRTWSQYVSALAGLFHGEPNNKYYRRRLALPQAAALRALCEE